MNPVLSVDQIRLLEATWANQHEGSTWPLMQQAAEAFVNLYQNQFIGKRVTVVVGKGNNGGDGYYVAWLLAQQAIDVTIVAPFGEPTGAIDAKRAYQLYRQTSSPVVKILPPQTDIIIDALFGIGLNRELDARTIDLIHEINAVGVDVYAIDLPSGLNAETGLAMPVAVKADYTLSMIAFKPGLLTADGPYNCGELSLANLGLNAQSNYSVNHDWPKLIDKAGNGHKGLFGSVTVVGGNHEMAGAAILSGHAALKAGAGRVTVHCDEQFLQAAISQAPELMVKVLGKSPLMIGANHALVVGPGLGRGTLAQRIVHEAIMSGPQHGGVVDADGLRILAQQEHPLMGWVLTPHAGEAAALLGTTSSLIQADRVEAVKKIAIKYQAVVVLKGAGTLVSDGQQVVFCHPGHGAMASPGMGDVLAGMIGTFLAQGHQPMPAAVSAVNWHAKLGSQVARTQHSVFASDIIQRLPLCLA